MVINGWLVAATVAMGMLRLAGEVIRSLERRSRERTRARLVGDLAGCCGPEFTVTEQHADGSALTFRSGDAESDGSSSDRSRGGRGHARLG